MAQEIPHGAFTVVLEDNGDVKVKHKGEDVVWVDTYYMRPEGQTVDERLAGKPCVLVNAVGQDEPGISVTVGDDRLGINDIDWELVDDNRNPKEG